MDDLTGQTLGGRFRVEAFLGRGGMADVYKVWDDQRAVYMAMKILRSDLSEDVVFLRRFNREAETLGRLQHPNIVRCYGLGALTLPKTSQRLTFLLMDFIDGLTLRQEIFMRSGGGKRIKGDGMPPARILQIMRPVCAALHYAHKMGMIHCDLKPANIMIHHNSTVFLTDFGIARMAESATLTPAPSGTPAYMAPEQMLGSEPTPATDIYALGVVLFEMLTGGERPFTGESAQETGSTQRKVVWEKLNLPPPSPRTFRTEIEPSIEAIVMRCLARDPKARYASALDLLHALEAAIREEENGTLAVMEDLIESESQPASTADEPEGPVPPFEPPIEPGLEQFDLPGAGGNTRIGILGKLSGFARRVPQPRVLVTALALVLIGGIVLAMLRPGGITPRSPATQAIAGAVAPVKATASTVSTSAPTATLTPLPSETPQAPSATPFLASKATGTATPTGGAGRIAFASDRSGSVQIWIMDPNGDSRVQITNARNGACQPAWSPDGKSIAYITPCNGPRITYPGASIRILNLDTGKETIPNLPGGGFDPAWSPDGKSIAYTAIIRERTEIHLLTLSDLKTVTLSNRGAKSENPAWSPDGGLIAFTSDDKGVDEVWIMRKDGKSQEVFSQAGPLKNFYKPHFSPDGAHILANLRELNVNVPVLVLFDRSNPRAGETPLLKVVTRMEDASFSPDGQWMAAWSVVERNNMEIYRVDISGNEIKRLTDHIARDFHPAWSPQAP